MSNFKKLSAINIKDLIAKKGKHSYLSWASAWSLIKEEFPTTQRLVYENEHTGLNYFTDGTSAYVKVGITIDGLEHIDYLPIMDYRNQSIKIDKVTSMDVNTAIQRSTAKAIAMHGLKVLKYVSQNKTIGLPKIVKNLETKYSIKANVKKELSKHV